MTDDQGWGDFGFHANPHLKTPHLDRLAAASTELTSFYVSPVCSPTRASLMTGRYNYRTGAIDTFLGRSTMAGDEVTIAEMLASAGYRTGIFGKWHLGDNYPCRSMDQGFEESLVCRGGGVGQPADPPGTRYLDPTLVHNGKPEKVSGYCSDVFTNAAIRFVEQHRGDPFFVYLAFNCPHTPLELPPGYEQRYQGLGLDDTTSKIYAMIANIDDNLGRLLGKLDELKLADNTIVVFLTDNGPQQPRFNGVFRDRKGSVYDGGIHVPCLLRWPGKFAPGAKNRQLAAHIDIAPTLLDACGVRRPANVAFDGASLLGVLTGKSPPIESRQLFFQWHRGDRPELGRACAARLGNLKLVQSLSREGNLPAERPWELYDLSTDPGEQQNLIVKEPELAARMKAAYEKWFADVSSTRGYPPPQIIVGTKHENPTTLTRQDWRGPQAGWQDQALGDWQIEVAATGPYDITLRLPAADRARKTRLRVGELEKTEMLPAGAERVTYSDVQLPKGVMKVEGAVERGDGWVGVHYIDLAREPVDKP
jgi:arylsulfatase A-like enzyme